MAAVRELEKIPDELEQLVSELKTEIEDGPDFSNLARIVDEISAHADGAATTFKSMNDALTSHLHGLGGERKRAKAGSAGAARTARP